ALAALYFVERLAGDWRRALSPLARLGRRSLFVYWIHVELVYGYATWAIHRRLPFWGAVGAYAVVVALMYVAVVARARVVEVWRLRERQISFRHKVEPAGPAADAGSGARRSGTVRPAEADCCSSSTASRPRGLRGSPVTIGRFARWGSVHQFVN